MNDALNLYLKVHHSFASPISPRSHLLEIWDINREKETPPIPLGILWLMVQMKLLPCELIASITFTQVSSDSQSHNYPWTCHHQKIFHLCNLKFLYFLLYYNSLLLSTSPTFSNPYSALSVSITLLYYPGLFVCEFLLTFSLTHSPTGTGTLIFSVFLFHTHTGNTNL